MKKITLLLLILSNSAFSQTTKKEVQKNKYGSPQVVVTDKQAKARMQVGNKHNDKYSSKYNYQNNNQTIVCESIRGRRNHCNVDTRHGVNFIRQLSDSSCNRHWGYDQTGIWVDAGCRAEFSINYDWDHPESEGNIMICESHNYSKQYCSAYLNGRDVFILRQLSSSSCQNNWGYDRNSIWVNNGCRAEFALEDRNHNFGNDIVVCSSRNSRLQDCPANTSGGVDFVRQLSRATCNGNWGYDQQGIWVNNGCRAKFKLRPQNNYGNNGIRIISCSSKNHQRRTCPADTSGGVRLKKQKSKSSCTGNWGFDRRGIWVTNGCRASFELHINGNQGGFGNNNGYGNNGHGNQQSKIVCASRNSRKSVCAIPLGSKVNLTKKLSRSSCTGQWGYNRREIWVDNGCRAEFRVY